VRKKNVAEQRPKRNHTRSKEEYDVSDNFSFYLEYNKVLRAWFVAFGIGGPAFFLINEHIAHRLAELGELNRVATLFLVGAASQILGAFLNKVVNWYVYMSETAGANTTQWKYKAADWLLKQFWIDMAIDVLTMGCFGVAAWHVLVDVP